MRRIASILCLLVVAVLLAVPAHASDPCPLLRSQTASADAGTRIAAIACEEHLHWHRPFIDERGRVAGSVVRQPADAPCSPDQPDACDANRQDWTVLLQLQPAQTLAVLPPAPPWPPLSGAVPSAEPGVQGAPAAPRPSPMCCVECVAGDGLPRCPVN